MESIGLDELLRCLEDVLGCGAFELHFDGNVCTIPYMMNDAVECTLILSPCRMTGQWLPELKGAGRAELVTGPQNGIIIRQERENVFTLWFNQVFRCTRLYRYGEIGHFWVKGQEQWRRLTYMLGTMHDKAEFLGEQACNEQELALLPLVGFRPLRMYSPIEESLDGRYGDTAEGARVMSALAREAGDYWFAGWTAIYARLPMPLLGEWLGRYLASQQAVPIYTLLCRRTVEAANAWPARDYGPEENRAVELSRAEAEKKLRGLGFCGIYPLFHRGHTQVLVTEEHPFTVFESEDFRFRIWFMVSTSPFEGLCTGFFTSPGNSSYIAGGVEEIERRSPAAE
ncbi:MAG: DUF3878 family protein [Candidatus Heteroscillospira sp.]|jgi:hypothetical protein